MTLEQLAERVGTSPGYLSDMEKGKRRHNSDWVAKFAAALALDPTDLFRDPANPGLPGIRTVPVISWVAAGRMADPAYQLPRDLETIEISGLESGDYFATRVSGDSMDRISPDGSMILVNRLETEPRRGQRYIFSRRGETTYKRFETSPLRLVPESTNPMNEPIFPRSDEEWEVIGRVRMTLLAL